MIYNASFERMIKEYEIKLNKDGGISFSCKPAIHSDKDFMEVQRTLPHIKDYMVKRIETVKKIIAGLSIEDREKFNKMSKPQQQRVINYLEHNPGGSLKDAGGHKKCK